MKGRNTMTGLTAVAAVTSLALLVSCAGEQSTDPTAIATGATAAAKGGNGNGGGNGGGKGGGGSTTTADPAITLKTFDVGVGVGVMNGDGSRQTLLASGTAPAWAPGGAGTVSDRYRISYSETAALTIIDVAVIDNTPEVVGSISHPSPSPDLAAWSPAGTRSLSPAYWISVGPF